VARILIIGGGCRARALARELARAGHAVRITTRSESGRAAIESSGAECYVGTPDRLATLRGALDRVAVACWLLAGASGEADAVAQLHSSRLEAFVHQLIDTTARGFVYERGSRVGAHDDALADGERIARRLASLNAIPLAVLDEDIRERDAWMRGARRAIDGLLGSRDA
jgi:hypothetical protein